MKRAREVERIVKDLHQAAEAETHDRILNRLLNVLNQHQKLSPAANQPTLRRIVMKSPITRLAAAAVVVLALVLSVSLFVTSTPSASAAEVFYQAAQAMGRMTSFHIRVEMRTPPGDNFAHIGLDYDFVTIDFWKQFTEDEWGKWRLESPGRIVVMDGQKSIMLSKPEHVVESVDRNPERYWRESLVQAGAVMTREAQHAAERPADFSTHREPGADGRDKIVIAVEAPARVAEGDYLRNKYIEDSDHLKVYSFDAETKLLEDLQIFVHAGGKDVLVYRLVRAEYNVALDPRLFRLELPPNAIYYKPLEVLPDNAKHENMTPKEAATAFFTACASEDWDEALKFMNQTRVSQRFKDYLGSLEIIEIGEPFQSGSYAGWFVPYQLRLKSGALKSQNLALVKDPSANRFVYDGGI
ncbi:MAG: hypothetical protein MUC88_05590 [Planctomycetes bacterium]|nr:hypothetical protein [Planctomycetota bacterium]